MHIIFKLYIENNKHYLHPFAFILFLCFFKSSVLIICGPLCLPLCFHDLQCSRIGFYYSIYCLLSQCMTSKCPLKFGHNLPLLIKTLIKQLPLDTFLKIPFLSHHNEISVRYLADLQHHIRVLNILITLHISMSLTYN